MSGDRIELVKGAFRMRDTFALRSHLRKSTEEHSDTNSSSSDDDIKELSRAEENKMRRSFRLIQTGPTEDQPSAFSSVIHKQINEEEAVDGWSDEQGQPMGRMEKQMTNRGYDSTGDETTTNRAYNPVHQFQPNARDGTPDSTASSGQRILFNNGSRPTEFNPTNIDTHKQSNIGKSMRVILAGMDASESAKKMSLSRDSKDSTFDPDETALKEVAELRPPAGTLSIEAYRHDLVTDRNQDETDTKPEEDDLAIRFSCLSRCAFLAIGTMIVLGGIVALLAVSREKESDKEHGEVYTINQTVDVKNDCLDVNISIGNQIVIRCQYDKDNSSVNETNVFRVAALNLHPQQITADSFTATRHETSNRTVIWDITGPNVTCSLAGTYRIEFVRNVSKSAIKVLHTVHTEVRTEVNTVTTSTNQRIVKDDGDSQFDVECSIKKVCKNYDMNWVASQGSTNILLNQHKSCNVAFSDKNGYSIQCNGSIPEKELKTHSDNGTLYCQLSHGDEVLTPEEFKLPSCDQNCSVNDTEETICMDEDNPTNDTCDSVKQCFSSDRFYTSCSESNTCHVNENCTLKWCRNSSTQELINYPNFVQELCQEQSANVTFAPGDSR